MIAKAAPAMYADCRAVLHNPYRIRAAPTPKNAGCMNFVVAPATPASAISFTVLVAAPQAQAMMMLVPPSEARAGVIAVDIDSLSLGMMAPTQAGIRNMAASVTEAIAREPVGHDSGAPRATASRSMALTAGPSGLKSIGVFPARSASISDGS